jgi:hypothetical protein
MIQGRTEQLALREIWGGFDFSRFASLNSDDTLLVPVSFDVFTVPSNVAGAEITRLHVGGEPEGLWYQNVSWLPIVSGGGPQEILAASVEPLLIAAGAAIPSPDYDAASRRNAGIRYVAYGSLQEPMPVSIKLAPGQTFGVRIISVRAAVGTAFMCYARALGVYFRS